MLRALLELLLIGVLLAVGVMLEHGRDGVTLFSAGFAALFAGSIFSRLLVMRGRLQGAPMFLSALELASFSGLLALPFGRWSYGLVGLVALYRIAMPLVAPLDDSPRASWREELAVLAIPVGTVAAAFALNRHRAEILVTLPVLIPLLLEAYGPRSPRSTVDAARRAASFGVFGAAVLLAGQNHREDRVDDAVFKIAAFLAVVAALEGVLRIATTASLRLTEERVARMVAFGDGRGRIAAIFLALLLAGIVLCELGALRIRVRSEVAPSRIAKDSGHSFRAVLTRRPDLDDGYHVSTLEVREDGRLLGPRTGSIRRVRDEGGGVYAHDQRNLWFSTSDGADPTTSGRRYTVEHEWRPSAWLMVAVVVGATLLNARRIRRFAARLETARPEWIALGVALVALAFRCHLLLKDGGTLVNGYFVKTMPFSDAAGWFWLSRDFSHGVRWSGQWTCWDARRPFYYVFLGGVFALTEPSILVAQAANILLSVLGAVAIFDAVRRLSSPLVAILGALAHALHVTGAHTDLSPLTEPLGTFLSDVTLWAFVVGASGATTEHGRSKRAALAFFGSGVALGLSNLTRPLTLPAVVGLPVALFILRRRCGVPLRAVVLAALLCGAGCAATITPWLLRQHAKHGIWTISDNAGEALYGATDPRFGQWTSEVSAQTGPGTFRERAEFFSAGAARNLRQHYGWYVGHVIRELVRTVDATCPPMWVFAALGAWSAALVLGAAEPLAQNRARHVLLVAGLLVALAPIEGPPLYALAALALFAAILRRDPLALVLGMHVPTLLAVSMLALSTDPRFCYPLTWQRTVFASEAVLVAVAMIGRGEVPPSPWPRSAAWGRAGRVLGVTLVLAVIVWAFGVGRAVSSVARPKPETTLARSPWVERALEGEGSVFRELADRLVARRTRVPRDLSAHFAANEDNRHWSPLFDPRPYDFTVFQVEPEIPEGFAVFPGELPRYRDSDELVLVGVPMQAPSWGHSLEVAAIGVPRGDGGVTFLYPPAATARAFVRDVAAVTSRDR